jgi:hypothetical protein
MVTWERSATRWSSAHGLKEGDRPIIHPMGLADGGRVEVR